MEHYGPLDNLQPQYVPLPSAYAAGHHLPLLQAPQPQAYSVVTSSAAAEVLGWETADGNNGRGGYPSSSASVIEVRNPGSRDHDDGSCRPCNKFNTPKGCRWGDSCAFCHRHADDPDVKHRGQLGRFGQAEKRWREKREEVYNKDPRLADLLEKIYGHLHRQCTLIKGKLHDDVVEPLSGEEWVCENPTREINEHMYNYGEVIIPNVLEKFEFVVELASSTGEGDTEDVLTQQANVEDAASGAVTDTVTSTNASTEAEPSSALDWLDAGLAKKKEATVFKDDDMNNMAKVRDCERKEREWRRQRETIEKNDKANIAAILDKIYKDLDKRSIRCKGKLQILLKQERQREGGMDMVEMRIDKVLEEVDKIKQYVFSLRGGAEIAASLPEGGNQKPALEDDDTEAEQFVSPYVAELEALLAKEESENIGEGKLTSQFQ